MEKTQKFEMNPLEYERLFGKDRDLFKNLHACRFLYNIIATIGLHEIYDNDFFCTVKRFLTEEELLHVYNTVLPQEKREQMKENGNQQVPEPGKNNPLEWLIFLNENIGRREYMWEVLKEIFDTRIRQYHEMLQNTDRKISALEQRFMEMKKLFSLSDREMDILLAIFFSGKREMDFGDFSISGYRNDEKLSIISKIIGVNEIEVLDLLSERGNIGKYNLIDQDCDLDPTFQAYLAGLSSQALSEKFWRKFEGEVLPWDFHGKLAEKSGSVLKEMILSKNPDTGLSVLLFGVAGAGKSSFAASLAKDLGKDLYFIAQNDDDNRRMSYSASFRYAALAVAQKQLDPEKCILVMDECDKLVENCTLGGGLLNMLGIDAAGSRDGESKAQLNTVIDQNRHTILWICNSKQEAIDPSSRRRFDYSIFFDDLSATSRKHIWLNALKFHHCSGKLNDDFLDRISLRYPVNPGGISVAVKNAAALCKTNPGKDFENTIMTFLKAHCSLLGIQEYMVNKLEPARDYSLDGLNIKSGIKLPRLIEVCRNYLKAQENHKENRDQPRMNLLLFGVPGSGKTEFVKYLAKQLDKPLCIKDASDLLNCYVGGTEQRIAAAFAEAELNGEILFIDEGDSLLGSRENASRSWEVSQVNTLLAEMERFRGIFIVGTNLIQRLDQAALRRFSFRLHFDYLNNDGKEIFFRTYFKPLGMPDLSADEKKELFSIDNLTPSDFRNTRQQFCYLEDSNLTNKEIIEALSAEVASKTSGSNYTGLGKIASKIGL